MTTNETKVNNATTEPFSENSKRCKSWYKKNREKKLAYQKQYRKEHSEQVKAKNRKYWRKLKLQVLSHYSEGEPKCACCDETQFEFLTLDHINGDGVKHRKKHKLIAGTQTFLWIIKNNFPPIFQTLCYNCNCAKRTDSLCPHQKSKGD